jgi:nucleoside-diphosphate-sugar epimerase
MRVLVTGGTGFTGKALVERLLDGSHQVIALDNKEGIQTEELRRRGAEVVIGSVVERELIDRCMDGVDIVCHLAAAFRELNVSEEYYWQINVEGTRIVLDSALKHGVRRFVHCSTCGVHGDVEHPPADEDAPIRPADYYQRTKYEAEPLVDEYFRRGLRTVILRPAAIYGPGDPGRFLMIFKLVARGVCPMFGSGKTLYHPLYIDNLVDSFLLAMKDGCGDGRTYLIADEEYFEIEALARHVARALDIEAKFPHFPLWPIVATAYLCESVCRPLRVTPPIFMRRVDWYRQNRAFQIGRAKRELGYAPQIGIQEGLRRTAEWYIRNGYLVPPSRRSGPGAASTT